MAGRRFALTILVPMIAAGCGGVEIPAQTAPPKSSQRTTQGPTGGVGQVILRPPPQRSAPVQRTTPVERAPVQSQTLATPKQPAPQPQSDAVFVNASAVTVGKGDTVYALSRRHRVPVQAIIRANDLDPPYLLTVGQRIELPRGRQYTIGPGDTLYSIAQRYDVSLYELARLNGIEPPYTARLGAVLVIPDEEPVQASRQVPSQPIRPPATPAPSVQATPQPAPTPRPAPSVNATGQIVLVPPSKPPAPVPPPPARSKSGFVWPLKGRVVSNFGAKDGGLRNDGINIRADRGTPIVAAENGVVAYAGNEIRGFGNLLLIKHDGGYITAYAHSDALLVKRGERVKRGQKIATVGSTGSVTSPQLHFEVRKGRRPQDPRKYLSG